MVTLAVPVTADDHIQGNENAGITLVAYCNYECTKCAYANTVIKRLQIHFNNNLRFVFRNFSLADTQPLAEAAAETAEFSSTHGRFWEMHDLIYENCDRLSMQVLFELAKKLNLPIEELKDVLISRPYLTKIRNELNGATHSGVNKVPTLFINNELYDGILEYDALVSAMEKYLRS